VYSLGARLDCKELVKGQHAWFAAFPAYACTSALTSWRSAFNGVQTFLPLVEDGWPGVVVALVVLVLVSLAAAFVDALLRHGH
jgi:hypothetical protein